MQNLWAGSQRRHTRGSPACLAWIPPLQVWISSLYELEHSYIPIALFERIVSALQTYQSQYGTASSAFNETGVERPISAVIVPLDIMLMLPDHVCYVRRIFRRYYKPSRVCLAGGVFHQRQNRDNIILWAVLHRFGGRTQIQLFRRSVKYYCTDVM
jgi:hypothetical protein